MPATEALRAPLYWIATNAGLDGSVVINKVNELPAGHGLNADTLNYGDLVADAIRRIERGQRVLKDHRDAIAADLLHGALAEAQ